MFNDLVIIRSLRAFDRIVEDIAIAMLGNLAMEHSDDCLEAFVWKRRDYLCVRAMFAAGRSSSSAR